ncbi:hypothetical protein [Ferruginibacter sp. SUN106]|uniref:hypothetical protein n=1 Tax=Ferruginibacter sp. SUN106 TaxID=2978348 RepID=UPI003D36DD55
MIKSFKIILPFLLVIPFAVSGQKGYTYLIDTSKILSNENLDPFIQKLSTDSFTNFTDKKAIPKFIKKQLDAIAHDFSIANPNENYRCCCMSSQKLPARKLQFLSVSNNVLAMTYLTGGWGVSSHLLLIRFEQNKIVDLWTGYYSNEVNGVADIVKYLNERRNKKEAFNTNIIIL